MITSELFLKVPPEKLGEAANSLAGYQDTIALAAKAEWIMRHQPKHDKLWNEHLFEANQRYASLVESCSSSDLHRLIYDEGEMRELIRTALKKPGNRAAGQSPGRKVRSGPGANPGRRQ